MSSPPPPPPAHSNNKQISSSSSSSSSSNRKEKLLFFDDETFIRFLKAVEQKNKVKESSSSSPPYLRKTKNGKNLKNANEIEKKRKGHSSSVSVESSGSSNSDSEEEIFNQTISKNHITFSLTDEIKMRRANLVIGFVSILVYCAMVISMIHNPRFIQEKTVNLGELFIFLLIWSYVIYDYSEIKHLIMTKQFLSEGLRRLHDKDTFSFLVITLSEFFVTVYSIIIFYSYYNYKTFEIWALALFISIVGHLSQQVSMSRIAREEIFLGRYVGSSVIFAIAQCIWRLSMFYMLKIAIGDDKTFYHAFDHYK